VSPARGFIVAGAASHSGKTTLSVGLIRALRARGFKVAAAKCGPDYIDPRFLEAASGAPALNLDPWAMPPETLRGRLEGLADGADLILVEGVMGLYDGGPGAAGSTASLAVLTGLPVLLVIGAERLAQTAAALAEGCARLAEGFRVIGAIVNQVASERHADRLREGFARSSVPLLGLVQRDASVALPSRHLGLVQADEHADLTRKIARAEELITDGCDLDVIINLAGIDLTSASRGQLNRTSPSHGTTLPLAPLGQRVAVAKDVAFAFAYPHLLMDWRAAGAEISFFSPLGNEAPAADADAVFLPGGYPELNAGRIAAAATFRAGMLAAAQRGALIYGECGGYMVLGDELVDAGGGAHPMLALLPLKTSFAAPKLHLGYRRLTPCGGLPWSGPLSGHEFHFASVVAEGGGERLFEAATAEGSRMGPIGLRRGRVMGSFAHVIDRAASYPGSSAAQSG
jgi:cobyrinic acid a,c-diamide synthase